MKTINRNSIIDAQFAIEDLFTNDENLYAALNIIIDGITFASSIKNDNWNLNLDKGGNYLRFNVGQEYCIQATSSYFMILCMRDILLKTANTENLDIEYKGYDKDKRIISRTINEVPDCLKKVPNSIACVMNHNRISQYTQILFSACKEFICHAITHTSILTQSKNAHSIGAVEYLSLLKNSKIKQPSYIQSNTIAMPDNYSNVNNFDTTKSTIQNEIFNLSDEELLFRICAINKEKATTITHSTAFRYIRNQYIREFVLRKANGICADCNNPAPFISKFTNKPYLETHHIVPLSKNGKDSIENMTALCPNCHKKRHYG